MHSIFLTVLRMCVTLTFSLLRAVKTKTGIEKFINLSNILTKWRYMATKLYVLQWIDHMSCHFVYVEIHNALKKWTMISWIPKFGSKMSGIIYYFHIMFLFKKTAKMVFRS